MTTHTGLTPFWYDVIVIWLPTIGGERIYTGVIDTVDGNMLATTLKSTDYGESVTCCGNIACSSKKSDKPTFSVSLPLIFQSTKYKPCKSYRVIRTFYILPAIYMNAGFHAL